MRRGIRRGDCARPGTRARIGLVTSIRASAMGLSLSLLACSVGKGEGWVRSERLFLAECWNGPFDLRPTFFGANPHRDSLLIRVQRSDNLQENSDGLTIVVSDARAVRQILGQRLEAGLPPGVSPPGVPIVEDAAPPLVSLSLYLHNTCHGQNGTLYAVPPSDVDGPEEPAALLAQPDAGDPSEGDAASGPNVDPPSSEPPAEGYGITFEQLFSGDRNEQQAEERLTEARFEVLMADPRDREPGGRIPPEKVSVVKGAFRFFFQRGQPAQPFP